MAMSVCILRGFQNAISDKVVGFGSHIVVNRYGTGDIYEDAAMEVDNSEVASIKSIAGVRHLQYFASKGAMIKTDQQIHGVVFKGIGSDYDVTFFEENLVQGTMFDTSDSTITNQVIISQTISRKLNLEVGSKVRTYFWTGDSYKARAFTVAGIYNTDLTEFDEHYIVGDIRQIQKVNGWNQDQVGGYEILVSDFSKLDKIVPLVADCLSYEKVATSVKDENPTLFSWLELLNSNIVLIIVIMSLVCIVSIISALLIMIFEKTSMIGILKTIGATNGMVRRIFLMKSSQIIMAGILIGTSIAVMLATLQSRFRIIRLDSESYSVGYVPIDMDPLIFLTIALATVAVCLLALMLPTSYITRIEPSKSIRIE